MSPKTSSSSSLRSSVITGVAWMVAARWVVRALGFISTLILVRLLAPSDFGLVAMASIVVGLTQTLFSLGVETALIQNPRADETHFNTAWSIGLIQNSIVAAIILITSPWIADYYHEPRLVAILEIFSAGLLVQSFSNIGVVLFRKEMNFQREFLFLFLGKIVGFAPTVILAFWLRNYWALVIGTIVGNLGSLMLSYWMHPYRPRWNLARANEIWGFSQWLLLTNIGIYTYSRADQLVVRSISGNSGLGMYSVASEIPDIVVGEITAPISRAVMPGYAKILHDQIAIKEAFLKVLGVMALIAVPAGTGIYCLSEEIVNLALGENWKVVVPILNYLAISVGLRASISAPINLLITLGRTKITALAIWLEVIAIIGFALGGCLIKGVEGVAIGKVIAGIFALGLYSFIISHLKIVSLGDLIRQYYRPLLAATFMALGIWVFSLSFSNVHSLLHGNVFDLSNWQWQLTWRDLVTLLNNIDYHANPLPVPVMLAIKLVLGVVLYTLFILGLWMLAGRPQGAEAELLNILGSKLR